MEVISGGVTAPKGFLANASKAGLKKDKSDVVLIASEVPAVADGMFTTSQVKAAPVIVTKKHLRETLLSRVIFANSGNANSCTGERGIKDAILISETIAKRMGIQPYEVLLASTGYIGRFLDVNKIKKVIPDLVDGLSNKRSSEIAKAIMTTDTRPKEIAVRFKISGKDVVIGGVAKGAGMIHPNMATVLCFLTTDLYITRRALKLALEMAVERSYNAISVDGDMSTNDTVLIMANAMAKNPLVDRGGKDFEMFCKALNFVCTELAKMIVKDAEGASKFVEIVIKNAPDFKRGLNIGKAVASSNLVKTSIYGGDPNVGRIMASLGASRSKVKPNLVDVYIGDRQVVKNGVTSGVKRDLLKNAYKKKEIRIIIDLKLGKETVRIYTCDLTEKYVKLNSVYST